MRSKTSTEEEQYILFTFEGQTLISYWSNPVNSPMLVCNYFIDSLSEPSLSPHLSQELLRVFAGKRKVKRMTAGMEAHKCGSFLVCLGKKSDKRDQLSFYVQVSHLKNELLLFLDQWGKVDWEPVVLELVVSETNVTNMMHRRTLSLKPLKTQFQF